MHGRFDLLRYPIRDWLRHPDSRAFLRYVIVGVLQNSFFYGLNLALIWRGFSAWQAILLLYPAGVIVSFTANRFWSFGDRRIRPGQFRRYVALYVLVYLCAVALAWLAERAGISSWLVSLVVIAVAVVIIFLALNSWVFRGHAETPTGL